MKKAAAILCVLAILLSLSGCSIIRYLTSSPEERVAQWVATQQEGMEEINRQYEGTMECSMTAEGHNVIVTIRYPFITDDDENAKRIMANAIEAQTGTFADMYTGLRNTVADQDVKLILRACNANGEVLTEREIDAEYAAAASAAKPMDNSSLESYILSESFQDSAAAGNTEEVHTSALVEDGVVVILYTFTFEVDRTNLDDLREIWKQSFDDEVTKNSLVNMLRMLKQRYPDETKGLKVRVTDPTGDVLYEHEYQ